MQWKKKDVENGPCRLWIARIGRFIVLTAHHAKTATKGQCSFGVELVQHGQAQARLGVYTGEGTKNIAEYRGIVAAFEHCAQHPCDNVCFRVDNFWVCKQINGRWSCRSPCLQPLYEKALSLFEQVRASCDRGDAITEHNYREFNANADSLANEALDNYDTLEHRAGVVINMNWFWCGVHRSVSMQEPWSRFCSLYRVRLRTHCLWSLAGTRFIVTRFDFICALAVLTFRTRLRPASLWSG